MPAAEFLDRLYRVRGIKADFDAVALHPYAVEAETLEEMAEEMRGVVLENHDPRPRSTSPRWDGAPRTTPTRSRSSRGSAGQVRQLRDAYAI